MNHDHEIPRLGENGGSGERSDASSILKAIFSVANTLRKNTEAATTLAMQMQNQKPPTTMHQGTFWLALVIQCVLIVMFATTARNDIDQNAKDIELIMPVVAKEAMLEKDVTIHTNEIAQLKSDQAALRADIRKLSDDLLKLQMKEKP